MKKILFSLFFAAASLTASAPVVVFDWGDVLATNDRELVVNFMCDSFQLSETDFEQANLEKRKAMKNGMTDVDFWLQYAQKKGVQLPNDWPKLYQGTLKESIGANPEMFALIDELKGKKIRVGLLSNLDNRYLHLIRSNGFYKPFDPCLISCEMGLEKPDPKVYEMLLKTLDCKAEKVVFIDDKVENVEAAKKMGIDAFVFKSPEQVRQELEQRGVL